LPPKKKLEIVLSAPVQGEAGGRGVGEFHRAQSVPFGYFQTDTANIIVFIGKTLGRDASSKARGITSKQNAEVWRLHFIFALPNLVFVDGMHRRSLEPIAHQFYRPTICYKAKSRLA
jgi:hypothetical protein